jgi:hypothetical protein
MQPRPVRSHIYLPVLRFGITDEDWGLVILTSVLGYAVPFLLGLRVGGVPVEMIGWLVAMALSIAALNVIRRKNRPAWLRHSLEARLKGRISRRRLPGEAAPRWLKPTEEKNHGY